ncbi:MAG TPA: hypothetical protein VFZ66_27615 [Herpetosiphonaceae bacterium]
MSALHHTPWPVRIVVLGVLLACIGTCVAARAVADSGAAETIYFPLIVAGSGINAPTPSPTDPMPTAPVLATPTPVDVDAYQTELIRVINTYRVEQGCAAAIEQPMLMDGTRTWNRHMVETTVIEHSPMGYYRQFGYDSTNQRLGPVEVIQVGSATPAAAVQAWIDHAPHERLLRWCPFTGGIYEMGVSYIEPGYWVAAIGWWDAPAGTPTATPTATATPTPSPSATPTATPTLTPTATPTPTVTPTLTPTATATPTTTTPTPPTPTATPVDRRASQAELIRLINTYRVEQGCAAAIEHPMLVAGATTWNQQMAESGVVAHSPMGYYRQFGYDSTNGRQGPVEVIVAQAATPQDAYHTWLLSSADARLLRWCPFAGGVYEIGASFIEPGYWVAAIGWWDR